MTDCLIEDKFDGYPGVSTGEDGGKWLLLFNRIGTQYPQVFLQRHEVSGLRAVITFRQDRHRLPGRCRHLEGICISLDVSRNSGDKETAASLFEKGPAINLFHDPPMREPSRS